MLKVKIVDIQRKQLVATGEDFLDVEAEFTLGEEVFIKKLGYPTDTPKAEIKIDLEKHLKNEIQERQQRETNKEVEALDAAAEDTINSLTGEEIVADEVETVTTGKTKSKKNAKDTK